MPCMAQLRIHNRQFIPKGLDFICHEFVGFLSFYQGQANLFQLCRKRSILFQSGMVRIVVTHLAATNYWD
jgi:hypothetical protein